LITGTDDAALKAKFRGFKDYTEAREAQAGADDTAGAGGNADDADATPDKREGADAENLTAQAAGVPTTVPAR